MVYLNSLLLSLGVAATLSEATLVLPGSAAISDSGEGLFARQANSANCLKSNLIQSASALTGQEPGTTGIKAGQAPSDTDPDNFINFCEGQTITNGKQITAGSCNGIPMGRLPAQANMISAIITNPQPGVKLEAGKTFNISVQTTHLKAGNFVNPTTNYYTAPQDLDDNGDIIGHCHVTVQTIGSLTSTTAPDPGKFAFFKGIDDAGNGNGLLQAVVEGGLPAGTYRVCTMIAAQNHQPVAMPVAQRGAQDDCTKFEVEGGGVVAAGGGGGAGGGVGAGGAGTGVSASASTSTSATASASASASGVGSGGNATRTRGGRRGGRPTGRPRRQG